MKLISVAFTFLALAVLADGAANAQATRTWVSGVGDDVNPCSRTAPCKTFAGAISKTAAGGEISVLDPGGFGAVTITKAITINGDGQIAGILASLTNGVIVNAGVNDRVVLRNISINGVGNGINGIRYLAGKSLDRRQRHHQRVHHPRHRRDSGQQRQPERHEHSHHQRAYWRPPATTSGIALAWLDRVSLRRV